MEGRTTVVEETSVRVDPLWDVETDRTETEGIFQRVAKMIQEDLEELCNIDRCYVAIPRLPAQDLYTLGPYAGSLGRDTDSDDRGGHSARDMGKRSERSCRTSDTDVRL